MAGVKRFEDLVCWQLATELEDLVPALVANPKAAADRDFCDQLSRAAAKIAPQIAEGFARFLPRETAYYLRVAKGSLAEIQTQLAKARRRRYLPDDQQDRAEELARRTNGATTAFLKDRTAAAQRQKESKRRPSRKPEQTPTPPGGDPPPHRSNE
jgi:four helix bundle protein